MMGNSVQLMRTAGQEDGFETGLPRADVRLDSAVCKE